MKHKKIIEAIKYWSQVFLLPVYWLSFLIPRNKKIWVFGSTFGRRFADNPKYFYLYLSQYKSLEVKVIWISKDREIIKLLRKNSLEGYHLYSLKGIYYALRAKVYLYDNYSKDICFTLSGGAIKVNLWHGIPLKKIQNDNIFDKVRNPKSKLERLKWALRRISDEKPSDFVLTTSRFLKPYFSSAFKTNNIIINGYPRNDILISDKITNIQSDLEVKVMKELAAKDGNKKIVFYMPTFRDSEKNFFEYISLDKFQKFLEENGALFCIKLHPKSKLEEKFKKLHFNNIHLINSQIDPYPLLKLSNILITDYSSIYFDFMLMEKPIIFFAYDLKEYLNDSRELYFDYYEFTPGRKVYNQSELENAIINEFYPDKKVKKIIAKTFDNTGFASDDLFKQILRIVDDV